MSLRLYAATPGRRLVQIVADLLLVAWLILWAQVGIAVHDTTMYLAVPGHETEQSATALAGNFADARDSLIDVPLVGEQVAAPFDKAEAAARDLAEAGRSQVRAVERLALWLGVTIALIPSLLAAMIHLPLRLRFIRRATAGQRFIDSGADLDLFALRALSNQPMHVLARIDDDPAGAWRRRDVAVIERLAGLELRSVGLRPPRDRDGRARSAAG